MPDQAGDERQNGPRAGLDPTSRLCLTFDDGPDREWTARVLETLARNDVRATFFMLGERVEAAPQTALAVLDAGHDVQLHGHRHLRHSDVGFRELALDTERALAALADIGVRPSRWRAPWGVCTEATRRLARLHSLELIGWTIDSEDWRGEGATQMLARTGAQLHGGGIVLMHDALGPGATRADCANTVELLERLIGRARTDGLEVGALSGAVNCAPGERAA